MKINIIACAAIFNDKEELLLIQHDADSGASVPFWTLPGGGVEENESIIDGLKRELIEETGLRPQQIEGVIYTAQNFDENKQLNTLIWIFKINRSNCLGKEVIQDPDSETLAFQYFDITTAIEVLKKVPSRVVYEPMIAYLEDSKNGLNRHWTYEFRGNEDKRSYTPFVDGK